MPDMLAHIVSLHCTWQIELQGYARHACTHCQLALHVANGAARLSNDVAHSIDLHQWRSKAMPSTVVGTVMASFNSHKIHRSTTGKGESVFPNRL